MSLGMVDIGGVSVNRMIIGGNPFSGFSHQTPEKDLEMEHNCTLHEIHKSLRKAEKLGVNVHIARADHHVVRYLMEYWDNGGRIRWFAQTCPEVCSLSFCIDRALKYGATACFLHGGMMDYMLANDQLDELTDAVARIRDAGLPAGIAGHNPQVFTWAEENLDVDFYMCCYYNAAHRDKRAEHVSGMDEWFDPADRQIMVDTIQSLSKPAIHYKVLACGRNDPQEALGFVARYLRPQDAVCIGIYPTDHPDGLAEDIRLLEDALNS